MDSLTISWLLTNNEKLSLLFGKESLFYTVRTVYGGLNDFGEKVKFFQNLRS